MLDLFKFYLLLTSRILCVSLSKVNFCEYWVYPRFTKKGYKWSGTNLDSNYTIGEPLCPLQTLTFFFIFGPSYTNLGLCRIKWTPIWIVLETCLAIWDHNDLLFDTLRDYFGTHCTIYGDPPGSYLTNFWPLMDYLDTVLVYKAANQVTPSCLQPFLIFASVCLTSWCPPPGMAVWSW